MTTDLPGWNPFFNAKIIKKAFPASGSVHADEGNVEGREESENGVSEAHLEPSADQSGPASKADSVGYGSDQKKAPKKPAASVKGDEKGVGRL